MNYTRRRLHLKFSSSLPRLLPLLTPLWSSTFLFQLKLVVPTEHAISIMQQEEERQIHFKCSNFELDMQHGEILNKFKTTQRVEHVSEYFLKLQNPFEPSVNEKDNDDGNNGWLGGTMDMKCSSDDCFRMDNGWPEPP